MNAAAERSTRATRAFALVVLAAVLAAALSWLDSWIVGARFPRAGAWSDALPVFAALGLAVVVAAGVARRGGVVAIAGGVLGWAFGVHGAQDLPAFAANAWFADGPHGAPWMLLFGSALGVFVAAGPRSWRVDERLAAALVVAATGSANLFSRTGEGVFGLFAAGVVLHAVAAPWGGPASWPWRGGGRVVGAIAVALVAWILVAACSGHDVVVGLRMSARAVTGGLFAWSLAASLDRRGALRMAGALAVGGALALCMLAVDLMDALSAETVKRVLATRWRALGMHPNGVGPLVASTAVIAAALAVRSRGAVRIASGALALAAAAACWRTGSRASLAGLAVAGAVLAAVFVAGAPRRARTAALVLGALAIAAVAFVASPIGQGRIAKLEELATTQSAAGQRWHLWRTSLDAIADHPVTGLGPGQPHLRAAYARESYFDRTAQDFHPHQLLLAIAEGAGLPGLLLFLALVVALLELLRRAILARPEGEGARTARMLGGGLLAYVAAILTANQLDLGLSQNAFVPLWLWIALGLAVAAARIGATTTRVAGPARIAGAAVVGLVAALHPLATASLHSRAEAHLTAGDPATGARAAELLARVAPGDVRAHAMAVRRARMEGANADVLRLLRERTERQPLRPSSWWVLASEALTQRDLPLAAEAARRGAERDPRGPRMGDDRMIEGALALMRGDEPGGTRALLDGLRAGSDLLPRLPFVPLPRTADDPPEVKRRALPIGGREGAVLPWDALFDVALEEAIREASHSPVRARRMMRRVLEGYAEERRWADSLAALERWREAARSGRLVDLDTGWEIEMLGRLGRFEEARAKLDAVGREPRSRISLAKAELDADRPEEYRRSAAGVAADLARIDAIDAFFLAGEAAPTLEVAMLASLLSRDREGALTAARRATRAHTTPAARRRVAERLLSGLGAIGADLPLRAEALAMVGAAWRTTPRAAARAGAMHAATRAYLVPGRESIAEKVDAARARLSGMGDAERRLLAEIERVAAGGAPPSGPARPARDEPADDDVTAD